MAQYATNEHQQRFRLPLAFAKEEDRDGENRLSNLSPQATNLAHNFDRSSRNRGRAK
jgi:hypothetical protein